MLTLTGTIKDNSIIERKTKDGEIRFFQPVLVDFGDERKNIDVRLDSRENALTPGSYELDITSMIDVKEFYGQRRFVFKDFSSPFLKPIKKPFIDTKVA